MTSWDKDRAERDVERGRMRRMRRRRRRRKKKRRRRRRLDRKRL